MRFWGNNKAIALFLILTLAVVSVTPVLLSPIPLLLDFPNHLARLWLIMGGVQISPLNHFYIEDWRGIATNIGVDLVARYCTHLLSPLLLGRILLGCAVLLPPLGAVLLNRAMFRQWSPWQGIFFLLWCSQTLLAGFLNFQIGLGLAMAMAATDVALFPRLPQWQIHTIHLIFSTALLVVHPFALLFYCALLAAQGIGAEQISKEQWRQRFTQAATRAAICTVPVIGMLIGKFTLPGADPVAVHTGNVISLRFGPLGEGLVRNIAPFSSYNTAIDVAFAGLMLSGIYFLARRKMLRVHHGLLVMAGLLAIANIAMPNTVMNTGWINQRLPNMAVYSALCSVCLSSTLSRRTNAMIALALGALVCLRTLWIGYNWQGGNTLVEAVQQAVAPVPAGAKMITLQHDEHKGSITRPGRTLAAGTETFRHIATMSIVWQHAFIPTLFSQAGKQPVRIAPAYLPFSAPGGGILPSVHVLDGKASQARTDLEEPYISGWQKNFDYVLILNADRPDKYGPFKAPPALKLIKDTGFAQLYRIMRKPHMPSRQ